MTITKKYTRKLQTRRFLQLIKFGIISDDDLNKDGYITVAEALNTFSKFSTRTPDESMLNAWYSISKLEPTDDTYDSAKISSIILKKDLVLTHNDILNLNFADNLTNLQVLTWVMRLTQSFYGCTRYIKDTDTYSTDDIYTAVYYRRSYKQYRHIKRAVTYIKSRFL